MTAICDSSRYTVHSGRCARQRYWNYEFQGRGIVPKAGANYFKFGSIVHEGLEALAQDPKKEPLALVLAVDWSQLTGQTIEGYATALEYQYLALGIFSVFKAQFLDSFLARYRILHTELELGLQLSPLVYWACRPDFIVEDRETAGVYNINAKTTQDLDGLEQLYETSVQALFEERAISEHLGRHCMGTRILGISKGSMKGPYSQDRAMGYDKGHRLVSPFTYKWLSPKGDTYQDTYKQSYRLVPVWNLLPIDQWAREFSKMPAEGIIRLTDCLTGPEHLIESVIRQVVSQEEALAKARPLGLEDPRIDELYPRNLGNCNRDGGYKQACPYKGICLGREVVDESLWFPREYHHPIEEQHAA